MTLDDNDIETEVDANAHFNVDTNCISDNINPLNKASVSNVLPPVQLQRFQTQTNNKESNVNIKTGFLCII